MSHTAESDRSGAAAAASVAERAALGKAARAEAKRSSHGEWSPPPGRRSPVEILLEQDRDRVAELVPIRHQRMLTSPLAFYRAGALLMATDLARTPRCGLEAQLCGDAHLSNFGVFAAADRRLVFDCNDFDETAPGPFEWDLKRLATSLEIAARHRGFDDARRLDTVLASMRAYREAMRRFARMRDLDVWFARLDVADLIPRLEGGIARSGFAQLEHEVAKARSKDSVRALAKLTHPVEGEPRFVSDPPLITPVEELFDADSELGLRGLLGRYLETLQADRRHLLDRYRYAHAARKVVGVGSVGTRAWVVLLVGRDSDDPLILQAKEASASVLERFTGPSGYEHHGRRVVEGQRLMQAAGDPFLGWVSSDAREGGRDFYVRQLWDGKLSAEVETMRPRGMKAYARACGWTLARAHARSGDRIAIASYLGGGSRLDSAIADFATAYADQNQRDYEEVREAAAAGRVSLP